MAQAIGEGRLSRRCIGVDVGGSGIKGAVADVDIGELVHDRVRVPTPEDFGFDAVVTTVAEIVSGLDAPGPVGVGVPAVVAHGIVMSPPTAHEFEGWVGRDLAGAIAEATGRPAVVRNDADVAGTAEHRFGAGQGRSGVVMVFTLGTGVGSAMFVDGTLVPNTELGKLFLPEQKEVSEQQVASRVRDDEGLSWPEWGARLNQYFAHVDRLFTPDLIVVGGGVSKKHEKFLHHIVDVRCDVVPAQLRNQAGIVGAAVTAAETFAEAL